MQKVYLLSLFTNAQKIRKLEAINQKLSNGQITFYVVKITTNNLCNTRN